MGNFHIQIGFVTSHRVMYVALHIPRQGFLFWATISATAVTAWSSLRKPNGSWPGNLAQIVLIVNLVRAHNPRQGALFSGSNLEEKIVT